MDIAFFGDSWYVLSDPHFLFSVEQWPLFWRELELRTDRQEKVFLYISYEAFAQKERKKFFNYPLAGFWTASKSDKDSVLISKGKRKYEIFNVDLSEGFYQYRDKIEKIKEFIREGYTYQVNYTFPLRFSFRGDEVGLFLDLLDIQRSEVVSFLRFGRWAFLCLSPELFFERRAGEIVMEPMKGTWSVGNGKVDLDEKIQAENIMIVDMIRNDLGRICKFGSIRTDLFIKKYLPTVVQLISSVRGELNNDISWEDIFKAIFPSASVTGAPKIKTQQIIDQLEENYRGIYTGCLGMISLKKSGKFSVCIRTVELDLEKGLGVLGIGSGIVWDSRAHREYFETTVKAEFFLRKALNFKLIETMRLEDGKVELLDYHLERLSESARFFGFKYKRKKVLSLLEKIFRRYVVGLWRLRLVLDYKGKLDLEVRKFKEERRHWRVKVERFDLDDSVHLYHKTDYLRPFFDGMLRKAKEEGFDEVIFLDRQDRVLQGCITNVVIEKGGCFYTPAVELGVLPGIFRRYLIDRGLAREVILRKEDLGEKVFLCNALRGLIAVGEMVF